jgi:transposase InsO family protein
MDEQAASAFSAAARGRGCRRVRGCSGRIEYNTVRPHSALGYLTPTDYAKVWTTNHPALS